MRLKFLYARLGVSDVGINLCGDKLTLHRSLQSEGRRGFPSDTPAAIVRIPRPTCKKLTLQHWPATDFGIGAPDRAK